MPWNEKLTMSLREEFVALAGQEGSNLSVLCMRYGVSRKTGYKWLARAASAQSAGLADRPRRPHHSPRRTGEATEATILALRDAHPAWGGRKLRRRLQDLGTRLVPAASTITAILKRHGRIDVDEAARHRPWQRFEHAAPNHLWQMDFKGHFALTSGQRCQPLTVLDDHSRFNLILAACADQQRETVQARLTGTFRRYGLPVRMTMDNGAPWGSDTEDRLTQLTVWLMRLGIQVSHSRPHHPQTQGKDERFHRTLNRELLQQGGLRDLDHAQARFDDWRRVYNLERPHQAIAMATPATRYQTSVRPFPETLPAIEYRPDDLVRKVQQNGVISFKGASFKIGKALIGQPIALRPSAHDGVYNVYFCEHHTRTIDLRKLASATVTHVSEHV
jgi:transposase InsO family protein